MSIAAERAVSIADEVWIATALLHRQNPERADFSVQEIRDRVRREAVAGELRAGVEVHVRQHCIANRGRSPNRLRMLLATGTRTRRLFREGDPYDPDREGGRIVPARENMPERYHQLLDWYFSEYARRQPEEPDPILTLRGLGKELWADQHPDDHVRGLREGWA